MPLLLAVLISATLGNQPDIISLQYYAHIMQYVTIFNKIYNVIWSLNNVIIGFKLLLNTSSWAQILKFDIVRLVCLSSHFFLSLINLQACLTLMSSVTSLWSETSSQKVGI